MQSLPSRRLSLPAHVRESHLASPHSAPSHLAPSHVALPTSPCALPLHRRRTLAIARPQALTSNQTTQNGPPRAQQHPHPHPSAAHSPARTDRAASAARSADAVGSDTPSSARRTLPFVAGGDRAAPLSRSSGPPGGDERGSSGQRPSAPPDGKSAGARGGDIVGAASATDGKVAGAQLAGLLVRVLQGLQVAKDFIIWQVGRCVPCCMQRH